MIEKFLSLFERLVIAVENIAAAGGSAPAQASPPAEGPKPSRSRAAAKKDDVKEPNAPADNSFDFLGGSTAAPAKKYERGDVKGALEKLVAKAGTNTAFSLFQAVGGVQSLNDLPEDKFAEVIKAVEAELAKK